MHSQGATPQGSQNAEAEIYGNRALFFRILNKKAEGWQHLFLPHDAEEEEI